MSKKLYLTLGGVATVATPLITAVSCTTDNKTTDIDTKDPIDIAKEAVENWFNLNKAQSRYEVDFIEHLTQNWTDVSNEVVKALGQEDIESIGEIPSDLKLQYRLQPKETDNYSTENTVSKYEFSLSFLVEDKYDFINSFTFEVANESIDGSETVDSKKIANEIFESVEEAFTEATGNVKIETLINYTTNFRKKFTPEIASAIGIVGQFPTLPEGGQILYTMYYAGLENNKQLEMTIKFWGSFNGFLSSELHYVEFLSKDKYYSTMPGISVWDIANAAWARISPIYSGQTPSISKTIDELNIMKSPDNTISKLTDEIARSFGLTGTLPTFVNNGFARYTFKALTTNPADGQKIQYELQIWGAKENVKSDGSITFAYESSNEYKAPTDGPADPNNPNKIAANAAYELIKNANFKYPEVQSPAGIPLWIHELDELSGENRVFNNTVRKEMELSTTGKYPTLAEGSSAVYSLAKRSGIVIGQQVMFDLKIWGVHGGIKSDQFVQIEMKSEDKAALIDYPELKEANDTVWNKIGNGGWQYWGKTHAELNAEVQKHLVFKKYENDDAFNALLDPTKGENIQMPSKSEINDADVEFKMSLERWEPGYVASYKIEIRLTIDNVSCIVKLWVLSSDTVAGAEYEGAQKDIEEIRSNLQEQKVPLHSTVSVYKLDEIVDSFEMGQDENSLPIPTGPKSFGQNEADALGIGLRLPSDLKGASLTYTLVADMPWGNFGTYILMIYIKKESYTTEVKHFFLSADELLDYSK